MTNANNPINQSTKPNNMNKLIGILLVIAALTLLLFIPGLWDWYKGDKVEGEIVEVFCFTFCMFGVLILLAISASYHLEKDKK